jgi:hypothetical protein
VGEGVGVGGNVGVGDGDGVGVADGRGVGVAVATAGEGMVCVSDGCGLQAARAVSTSSPQEIMSSLLSISFLRFTDPGRHQAAGITAQNLAVFLFRQAKTVDESQLLQGITPGKVRPEQDPVGPVSLDQL